MKQLNEEAKRWLETYSHQLEPEEVLFEQEKIQETYSCQDEKWPTPIRVYGMGLFAEINNEENFNKIVGDPYNKEEILNNEELYNKWILPHAVLLFGKTWFDRVKWKTHIKNGVPFSLFNSEDIKAMKKAECHLENTTAGKALISTIINKTSFALRMFLSQERKNNNVGAYVVESIKNEIINYRGSEEGYRLQSVAVCPYCLSQKGKTSYKVPLIDLTDKRMMCPKCNNRAKNYKIQVESEKSNEAIENYNKFSKFSNFFGMSCVCPSDFCTGKFIPVEFIKGVNTEELQKIYVKSTKSFKRVPNSMLDSSVTCPFCRVNFTLKEAMEKKSGWKKKSGFLTGIPQAIIWKKSVVNEPNNERSLESINEIAGQNSRPENNIFLNQNLDILKNEILIQMSEKNKSKYSGLISWYFYLAAIRWMEAYPEDAFRYFFNGSSEVVRGNELSIHQSFFHIWMDVLEENISDFNKFNIYKMEHFKWFCHAPKFSHGPKLTLAAEVGPKKRVMNTLSHKKIRFARILSICRLGEDFSQDIKSCEWNAIQLKYNSSLQIGDKVVVEALVMPGHHSHAPIKRIVRLRQLMFNGIVKEIIVENKSGTRNKEFWEKWNSKLEFAKSKINLNLGGKTT